MTGWLAGALPVHDPAWITAVGGLITACGGVVGGALGALGAIIHGRRKTDAKLEVIKSLASDAKEQTTNSHGTNLRDDIDDLAASVAQLAGQVASIGADMRDGFRRMDHQLGEVHDRISASEGRLNQVDARITRVDEHAETERSRLWDAVKEHPTT